MFEAVSEVLKPHDQVGLHSDKMCDLFLGSPSFESRLDKGIY